LHTLANELHLDFEHCLVLPLDLELQHDCFKSKFDLALGRFGQIDVLINNAGISQRSFIRDTVYNVDSRLMNINFLGTITLSKTVLQVRRYFVYIVYKLFFSISLNVKKDISLL
jgi:short-subunit dehydrogenase